MLKFTKNVLCLICDYLYLFPHWSFATQIANCFIMPLFLFHSNSFQLDFISLPSLKVGMTICLYLVQQNIKESNVRNLQFNQLKEKVISSSLLLSTTRSLTWWLELEQTFSTMKWKYFEDTRIVHDKRAWTPHIWSHHVCPEFLCEINNLHFI